MDYRQFDTPLVPALNTKNIIRCDLAEYYEGLVIRERKAIDEIVLLTKLAEAYRANIDKIGDALDTLEDLV